MHQNLYSGNTSKFISQTTLLKIGKYLCACCEEGEPSLTSLGSDIFAGLFTPVERMFMVQQRLLKWMEGEQNVRGE